MRSRSSAEKQKAKAMREVGEAFKAFRPAREVLTVVRAVPTRFVQLDHATDVGGFPIERFVLVHGPSGEGKTYFTLGLIDSFLARGHFAYLIDAERTTPITWPERVMGRERAHHPWFLGVRPTTYEATVDNVREFVFALKNQRDKGNVDPETSAIVVCDSLRKLVPKNLWKQIVEDKDKNGVDGLGGRAGQIKAAMNAAWMDELVPLLEETGTVFVAIAREREDPDANKWDRAAGRDYKVGGGSAVYYDASLVARVERAGWVMEAPDSKKVYGERHRVTIVKTKVSGHEEKQTASYFHTSNGAHVPFGFDRARDLLEMGERFGVVEVSGSWFSFQGERVGNGRHAAVKTVAESGALMDSIEAEVRERFSNHEPLGVVA